MAELLDGLGELLTVVHFHCAPDAAELAQFPMASDPLPQCGVNGPACGGVGLKDCVEEGSSRLTRPRRIKGRVGRYARRQTRADITMSGRRACQRRPLRTQNAVCASRAGSFMGEPMHGLTRRRAIGQPSKVGVGAVARRLVVVAVAVLLLLLPGQRIYLTGHRGALCGW